MAAGLLRMAMAGRESLDVRSAGLLEPGWAPPSEVMSVMAALGSDVSAHRSEQLSSSAVAQADLVIGMQRMHAREVVVLAPATWPCTFTLKEIVRRGESAGEREPGQSLGSWIDQLHQGRARSDLLGASADDDVDDPIGGPIDDYQATARDLRDLMERLARVAWPARGITRQPA
jgi:protein-tyrosine-phosphatase